MDQHNSEQYGEHGFHDADHCGAGGANDRCADEKQGIAQPDGCRTASLGQILDKNRMVPQISGCPGRAISPAARRAFLRESGGAGAVPPGNQVSGFA